jgi:hypothetical protein
MPEKGILTKVQEEKLAQIIDDSINAKGVLELIDGYVAKVAISLIDDSLLDKISKDDIKLLLGQLVDAAIAEDVELSEELAAEVLDKLVDVPLLDDETEDLLFEGAVKLIVGAVLNWIKKRQNKDE